MQKSKTIIRLLILLLLLSGLLVFRIYTPKFKTEVSPYNEKIKDIDSKEISSIEISKKEEEIELKKDGDVWRVNDKKADKEKVEKLISQLLPEEKAEVIAETNQRHKEFALTDDLSSKIKLGDTLTVLVGKSESSGAYLRMDGEDRVFLFKNFSSINTSTSPSFWFDKTIVSLEEESIKKLIFERDGRETIVIRKDEKWIFEEDEKEVEKNKVESILFNLSSLTGDNLLNQGETKNYPKTSVLTLTVEYDGGKETLTFLKGKTDYMVVKSSDGESFAITEGKAEIFTEFL